MWSTQVLEVEEKMNNLIKDNIETLNFMDKQLFEANKKNILLREWLIEDLEFAQSDWIEFSEKCNNCGKKESINNVEKITFSKEEVKEVKMQLNKIVSRKKEEIKQKEDGEVFLPMEDEINTQETSKPTESAQKETLGKAAGGNKIREKNRFIVSFTKNVVEKIQLMVRNVKVEVFKRNCEDLMKNLKIQKVKMINKMSKILRG